MMPYRVAIPDVCDKHGLSLIEARNIAVAHCESVAEDWDFEIVTIRGLIHNIRYWLKGDDDRQILAQVDYVVAPAATG